MSANELTDDFEREYEDWLSLCAPELRRTEPLEGSMPCRLCGELTDAIPDPDAGNPMSLRFPLAHDHFLMMEVQFSTTRTDRRAVCARCVTFALLTLLWKPDGWWWKRINESGEVIE